MKAFSSIFPFTHRLGLQRTTCITNDAQGGGSEADERGTFLLTYKPKSRAKEQKNRFRNEMAAACKGPPVAQWNCAQAWDGIPLNVGIGRAVTRWNCAKDVKIGDRGLLLWQGDKVEGIFGLVKAVTNAKDLNKEALANSNGSRHKPWWCALWQLDLRHCVQPEDEGGPLIPIGELREKYPNIFNVVRRSGIKIRDSVVADALVEAILAEWKWNSRVSFLDVSVSDDGRIVEGEMRRVTVNVYERNSKAREQCITKHGAHCCVCGFDFEEVYGDIGREFIEVHHLTPISQIGKDHRVNPEEDLCPVCPNCHAMLHKKNPPFKIVELREKIRWEKYPSKPKKRNGE